LAREPVQVRKAEQGTRPKVFYLGADAASLTPELQAPSQRYLWAERPREEVDLMKMVAAVQDASGGVADAARSRPVYDAPHAVRPWGFKVSAYLWTKSIAAGALLVAALAGSESWGGLFTAVAPALSLLFLAITTALWVVDLKRPERFAYILFKPNWRSWLVWGAFILMAFGAAGAVWLAAGAAGRSDLLHLALVASVPLALATAGYSAFLFGQAEGRDFWQSPLVLPHLIVGAVLAGSAILLLAVAASPLAAAAARAPVARARAPVRIAEETPMTPVGPLRLLPLTPHAFLGALEVSNRHAVHDATLAARLIRRGPYRVRFWGGVVLGGVFVPLVLLIAAAESMALTALGALLALAGLWLWGGFGVEAGPSVPLS